MHTLAFLHLLATQTASAPPGTLTIGEGVALGLVTAVVGVAVAYGVVRAQVADLRDRVARVEAASSPLVLAVARVEVRLERIEKDLSSISSSLHREAIATRRGEDA